MSAALKQKRPTIGGFGRHVIVFFCRTAPSPTGGTCFLIEIRNWWFYFKKGKKWWKNGTIWWCHVERGQCRPAVGLGWGQRRHALRVMVLGFDDFWNGQCLMLLSHLEVLGGVTDESRRAWKCGNCSQWAVVGHCCDRCWVIALNAAIFGSSCWMELNNGSSWNRLTIKPLIMKQSKWSSARVF